MTTTTGGALFTAAALDTLAYWQRANMPDRAFVFTRVTTRAAGAVLLDTYVFARVDACRLSLSLATERNDNGTWSTSNRWTLARAREAEPLAGTERVLVLHATGGATLVRVAAEAGRRTFQTLRKADVTTDGVEPLAVATAPRAPLRLGWRVMRLGG